MIDTGIKTTGYIVVATVLILVVTSVFFYIHSLKEQIDIYKSELNVARERIAYFTLEKERITKALDEQSKEVELLKLNEKLALKKLQKWKIQKPEVKYRTITKFREVKSDECKDIKNTIDAVKHIDFTSL